MMAGKSAALRVIEGDLNRAFSIGGVTLRLAAAERRLPSAVQVVVVEQDTSLLLDESLQLDPLPGQQPDNESTASLIEAMLQQGQEYPPGSVHLRGGNPARILMIIHDLNANPSWNEEGLQHALHKLFSLLARLHYRSLALPALAHRYGPLPVTRFLTLLCEQLRHHPSSWHGTIWLLLPRHDLQRALETLHRLCDIEAH